MRWVSLLLFLLFACTSSPEQATLLLDWWPNPNHIPLFVGVELGFFADEGLDLRILKMHEPRAALTYLSTGRADIALYYPPSLANAPPGQFEVIAPLITSPLQCFGVLSDSPIRSALDFDGRTIGCNPDGTTAKLLRRFESTFGIHLAALKKVHFDTRTALLTGSVDAVSGLFWNIEPLKLSAAGFSIRTIPITELGIDPYPELVCVVLAGFDAERRSGFLRGLSRACAFCRSHPDEAFALYLSLHPRAAAWERESWALTLPLIPDPSLILLIA